MNIKIFKNKKILICIAVLVAIISILIGVSVGSADIKLTDIFKIILGKIFNREILGIKREEISIIWIIRLPRVIFAFIIGGILSVAGCITQSILKNPIASPYTIGVSSGASLGVGICIITGITIPILGDFMILWIGFLCSVITIFLVVLFSNRVDKNFSSNTVILVGMVFSLFTSAILTTLTAIFSENIKNIMMWQLGSFSLKGWRYIILSMPFLIIGLGIALFYTKELDIISFGDDIANTTGVDVKRVKKVLLLVVAVLSGIAVALSGVIGFVDLIIPHVIRKIFGFEHSLIIPMSFFYGGVFMIYIDLISRTVISPSELPIGAITAIIGAPFFAYIYFRKEKNNA